MAVLVWQMLTRREDYAWSRPALNAHKVRDLEVKAGFPSQRGGSRGKAYEQYNQRHVREQERRFVERSEKAYERFVRGWRPDGPKSKPERRTGATKEHASSQGCAARLAVPTPLFASWSPVRDKNNMNSADWSLSIASVVRMHRQWLSGMHISSAVLRPSPQPYRASWHDGWRDIPQDRDCGSDLISMEEGLCRYGCHGNPGP